MTRKAIITRRDGGQFIYHFSREASDEKILRHIAAQPNLHLIETVDLCTVDAVFNNTTALSTWLEVTDRLAS